jgi:thioredoxin 1
MELEVTDASFEKDVVKNPKPVMIDFWAPWCGPCRILTPVVEELAREYDGKVVVAKMNTDDNPSVATHMNISAIPTIAFFRGGRMVDQLVGLHSKKTIQGKLDALLK